jgi:septum site-determining protein MinC
VDFRALVDGLRALEIVPIGTTGGSPQMRQAATAAGLPPLRAVGGREPEADAPAATAMPPAQTPAGPPVPPPAAAPPPTAAAAPTPAPPPVAATPAFQGSGRGALVVTEPVRSGQRIYAEGADLIVTATVNPGGEVIADGNIHIYGALRGRAIAGAQNDAEARIFALNFDPELVAIAGFYVVREGLGDAPIGRPTQVRLDGEEMRFAPIG